jgi:hypothetical protein
MACDLAAARWITVSSSVSSQSARAIIDPTDNFTVQPNANSQYIAPGRAGPARTGRTCHPGAARLLLTRPDALIASQQEVLTGLTAACPR